ncbi:uncharacterized protein LOC123201750 [Mangifera indica]|uniref:uncharacterized protein LOC123201750 n=1 Tax=Mangifera indica TaxID=29780 RepID=UPI001CF947EC|nr:uncharacterized protein LOC123201750 [Mangifera indica]
MASMPSSMSPPIYNGENYHIWAVKMKAFLRGLGLWQYVEEEKQPFPLGPNPTLNQIIMHEEEMTKSPITLSMIHQAVTDAVFTKIVSCETAKEAWDRLKEDSLGNERSRQMNVLNLRREFEVLKMKEAETVKEYADRVLKVVNQIRLMGETLSNQRVVEKILVTVPERYEAKISSLEDSKDFSELTLSEVLNALKAQDQRRALRQEDSTEQALSMRVQDKNWTDYGSKKQFFG